MGRFDGKTIVVTGTASGIGRATAERLHGEGAAVVGADVAMAPADDPWRTHDVDVADEDAVAALIGGVEAASTAWSTPRASPAAARPACSRRPPGPGCSTST